MPSRIAIIQGHPDPRGARLCHALAAAYEEGALEAGHEVRTIDVAKLEFPLLRTQEEWAKAAPPRSIRQAQESVSWAQHLVIVYPLWLGTQPALLKGFLEQLLRPGFATSPVEGGTQWRRLLTGRSARIVLTMGMPAFIYRWYFGAHSLKSLERNVLRFCGIAPVRETLIGTVEAASPARRARWLAELRALGRAAR
jgi:putative NADPH-quinone reductase